MSAKIFAFTESSGSAGSSRRPSIRRLKELRFTRWLLFITNTATVVCPSPGNIATSSQNVKRVSRRTVIAAASASFTFDLQPCEAVFPGRPGGSAPSGSSHAVRDSQPVFPVIPVLLVRARFLPHSCCGAPACSNNRTTTPALNTPLQRETNHHQQQIQKISEFRLILRSGAAESKNFLLLPPCVAQSLQTCKHTLGGSDDEGAQALVIRGGDHTSGGTRSAPVRSNAASARRVSSLDNGGTPSGGKKELRLFPSGPADLPLRVHIRAWGHS